MSRPSAEWKPLVTQVTVWEALSFSSKRPEVWGTGHQWLKKAFEMVVNGTSSMGRETRGSWAQQKTEQGIGTKRGEERKIVIAAIYGKLLCPKYFTHKSLSPCHPANRQHYLHFARGGNGDLHYPDGKWQTENSIIVSSDSKVETFNCYSWEWIRE